MLTNRQPQNQANKKKDMITYTNVKRVYNGWTAYDLLLNTDRKFNNCVPASKAFAVKDHTLVQYEAFGREYLLSQ